MRDCKVHLLDLCMMKTAHVFFNSSLVRAMTYIYPKCALYFWGEKKHCVFVKEELLDIPNILFHEVPIVGHNRFWMVFSDLWSSLIVVYILFRTSKNDKIVLLNRLPITLLIYNIFNYFFKRQTISILHGELESIVNSNVKGATKYYYKLFPVAYAISNDLISYLVLGEPIRLNIQGINFRKGRLITIDHPYDYKISEQFHLSDYQDLRVGMIGAAMLRKNSELIFDLAKLVRREYNNEGVKFFIVGMLDKDIEKFINEDVITYSKNRRLSKEEYLQAIQMLDYSLLFYDENINIALASGSFFDCIKFLKPIICLLGNPFVDYYFKRLGNIGYQFRTIAEMASFINNIVNNPCVKEEYLMQLENLKKAKEELSLEKIAKQLERQIRL